MPRHQSYKRGRPTFVTRAYHEEEATRAAKRAYDKARLADGCDARDVSALARANRDIGIARSHLSAISTGGEGKRTLKLWGVVSRAEKVVDAAGDRMATCLRKCKGQS